MRDPRAPRSRQTRRTMAVVACVLWLAGFEVLPWMHVAFHDQIGPHHHDASGAIVLDSPAAVRDDDVDAEVDEAIADAHAEHDHDADAELDQHGVPIPYQQADHTRSDDRARLANALTHGQHSLAHHDVAIYAPPPPLLYPLPVDRRPTCVAAIATLAPISLRRARTSARDPPLEPFA